MPWSTYKYYNYKEQLNALLREYMGVPVLPLSVLTPEPERKLPLKRVSGVARQRACLNPGVQNARSWHPHNCSVDRWRPLTGKLPRHKLEHGRTAGLWEFCW